MERVVHFSKSRRCFICAYDSLPFAPSYVSLYNVYIYILHLDPLLQEALEALEVQEAP
jgi:hypothetical protein